MVSSDNNNDKSIADEANEDDDAKYDWHNDWQKSLHGVEVTVIGSDVANTRALAAQRQLCILWHITQPEAAHFWAVRIVEAIESAFVRDDTFNHVHRFLTAAADYRYNSGVLLLPMKRGENSNYFWCAAARETTIRNQTKMKIN